MLGGSGEGRGVALGGTVVTVVTDGTNGVLVGMGVDVTRMALAESVACTEGDAGTGVDVTSVALGLPVGEMVGDWLGLAVLLA